MRNYSYIFIALFACFFAGGVILDDYYQYHAIGNSSMLLSAIGFMVLGVIVLYFRERLAEKTVASIERMPMFLKSADLSTIAKLHFKSIRSYALFSSTATGVVSLLLGALVLVSVVK
jgi:hypothetical protein